MGILGKLAELRWSAIGTVLLLCSCSAAAHERCYVEHGPKGTLTCFLPQVSESYSCVGPTADGEISCLTKNGAAVDCVTKQVSLKGPSDVWCDRPAPASTDTPLATLYAQGERHASKIPNPEKAKRNPDGTENCNSYDMKSEYGLRERCLVRRAAIEGKVPWEDCDALLAQEPRNLSSMTAGEVMSHRFARSLGIKRRQRCLDRQAGVVTGR